MNFFKNKSVVDGYSDIYLPSSFEGGIKKYFGSSVLSALSHNMLSTLGMLKQKKKELDDLYEEHICRYNDEFPWKAELKEICERINDFEASESVKIDNYPREYLLSLNGGVSLVSREENWRIDIPSYNLNHIIFNCGIKKGGIVGEKLVIGFEEEGCGRLFLIPVDSECYKKCKEFTDSKDARIKVGEKDLKEGFVYEISKSPYVYLGLLDYYGSFRTLMQVSKEQAEKCDYNQVFWIGSERYAFKEVRGYLKRHMFVSLDAQRQYLKFKSVDSIWQMEGGKHPLYKEYLDDYIESASFHGMRFVIGGDDGQSIAKIGKYWYCISRCYGKEDEGYWYVDNRITIRDKEIKVYDVSEKMIPEYKDSEFKHCFKVHEKYLKNISKLSIRNVFDKGKNLTCGYFNRNVCLTGKIPRSISQEEERGPIFSEEEEKIVKRIKANHYRVLFTESHVTHEYG